MWAWVFLMIKTWGVGGNKVSVLANLVQITSETTAVITSERLLGCKSSGCLYVSVCVLTSTWHKCFIICKFSHYFTALDLLSVQLLECKNMWVWVCECGYISANKYFIMQLFPLFLQFMILQVSVQLLWCRNMWVWVCECGYMSFFPTNILSCNFSLNSYSSWSFKCTTIKMQEYVGVGIQVYIIGLCLT